MSTEKRYSDDAEVNAEIKELVARIERAMKVATRTLSKLDADFGVINAAWIAIRTETLEKLFVADRVMVQIIEDLGNAAEEAEFG